MCASACHAVRALTSCELDAILAKNPDNTQ